MSAVPVYPHDLYTEEVIREPYEHYRALRDLGPVVWLQAHDMYVLPRYAEVRAALADPEVFCSGRGVGMNDFINAAGAGTTLMSDGELHTQQRAVISRRLAPRALRSLQADVQRTANDVVDRLAARNAFDAVTDLARALPLSVVPDLVGWPHDGREHLLDWAAASFDALGPMNGRAESAAPRVGAMLEYAARTVAERRVLPCSAAAEMLEQVDQGHLAAEQASSMVVDLLAPSLDTTISAIGSAVWLFGRHPEQWDLLREHPSRIPNAFNEVVRMESPIRGFTRSVTRDTTVAAHRLPEDARVLILFASANRDERRWDRPEQFDITRDAGGHVGFGYGVHGCAGQGLARLEGQALLRALVERVERFELGPPTRTVNNVINALASLPVTIRPAQPKLDAAAPAGVHP